MPDRTACPYCKRVGFVRREHVIKGGKAVTLFYCGSCTRSWEVADGERNGGAKSRERAADRPDRSR